MKNMLFTILIFLATSNFSFSQKNVCENIEKALLEYKSEQLNEKINKGVLKSGALKVLNLLVKRASIPISAFTYKTNKESTGRDAYWDAYKKIIDLTNRREIDERKLRVAINQLKTAQNWILVEKDFGNNTTCYQNLKNLTKQISESCLSVCNINSNLVSENNRNTEYKNGSSRSSRYNNGNSTNSRYKSGNSRSSRYNSGNSTNSRYNSSNSRSSRYNSGNSTNSRYKSGNSRSSRYNSGNSRSSRYNSGNSRSSRYKSSNTRDYKNFKKQKGDILSYINEKKYNETYLRKRVSVNNGNKILVVSRLTPKGNRYTLFYKNNRLIGQKINGKFFKNN